MIDVIIWKVRQLVKDYFMPNMQAIKLIVCSNLHFRVAIS